MEGHWHGVRLDGQFKKIVGFFPISKQTPILSNVNPANA
jgi:hypothetical protein